MLGKVVYRIPQKDSIEVSYMVKYIKPGEYKAYINHHGILLRVIWLLLICEVATTTVKAMERKVSGYLRR